MLLQVQYWLCLLFYSGHLLADMGQLFHLYYYLLLLLCFIIVALQGMTYLCVFGHYHYLLFYGDILNFVAKQSGDSTIFNHILTTTYLPKNLIENIYSNLNKNNVNYIILIEPIGISQETGEMYKFNFQDFPSVRYKKNLFIHNYPGILKKYNYSVESCELSKDPIRYGEFLLKIIAKKGD